MPAAKRTASSKRAAAARETTASKKPATVEIEGVKFTLPKKLSHRLLPAIQNGDIQSIVEVLFGDQADRYWELDMSIDESIAQMSEIVNKLGLGGGLGK